MSFSQIFSILSFNILCIYICVKIQYMYVVDRNQLCISHVYVCAPHFLNTVPVQVGLVRHNVIFEYRTLPSRSRAAQCNLCTCISYTMCNPEP